MTRYNSRRHLVDDAVAWSVTGLVAQPIAFVDMIEEFLSTIYPRFVSLEVYIDRRNDCYYPGRAFWLLTQ